MQTFSLRIGQQKGNQNIKVLQGGLPFGTISESILP